MSEQPSYYTEDQEVYEQPSYYTEEQETYEQPSYYVDTEKSNNKNAQPAYYSQTKNELSAYHRESWCHLSLLPTSSRGERD